VKYAGMKPLRIKLAGRATLLAALGLIGVIVAVQPMQAADETEPLLLPTPLVLKDGRIANVSIHEVPFAPGQAGLTTDAGAGLRELTRAVGTDCFLTAQVIGHIDSSEIAEQDSLSAHRLARARADAVQASLIDGGLPAKAIASVWDWQFMVREARATLWVFQLTAGEDCEGRPLRDDLVAQAPTSRGQPATGSREAPVPAVSPPAPPRAQAAAPAPGRAMTEATAPRSASEASREAPAQAIVSAMAPIEPRPGGGTGETQGLEATSESQARAVVPAVAAAERAPAETPVATPKPGPTTQRQRRGATERRRQASPSPCGLRRPRPPRRRPSGRSPW
jgi:hypothetical protein